MPHWNTVRTGPDRNAAPAPVPRYSVGFGEPVTPQRVSECAGGRSYGAWLKRLPDSVRGTARDAIGRRGYRPVAREAARVPSPAAQDAALYLVRDWGCELPIIGYAGE